MEAAFDTDVIVAGAGPTGLMLASELRLGGARVVVLERREERSWESRGLGFTARATEILHQRGLLERLEDAEIGRQGHFGGIPLDYGVLEGSHFGVRGVPQYRIEEVLERRALELGAELRRGHEVTALTDTGDGVTVTVQGPDGPRELTASWLVACDGGHSTVRKLAGFDFPGSAATREMYLADVRGVDVRPRMIGEQLPNGMVMAGVLEAPWTRIIVCENGRLPQPGRTATFGDVADAWERLTGESIHAGEARWVSSFTDATRQVTEYRRGRVLIAGDAAHIHLPAGGQGLSIGVQDAANLGWKLAATVAGTAPEGLLDSYHTERHPVGARVLRNTRAQGLLNLGGTPMTPLRTVLGELYRLPVVGRHLSGMVGGFDIRYDVGAEGHPLLGMRVADRELELADGGSVPLASLLHGARGVLVTAGGADAAGFGDRVDVVRVAAWPARSEEAGAATESVLVRPDGYVAWVSPDGGELETALRQWFGEPAAAAATATEHAEHEVTIAASAERVHALIEDVGSWPAIFPPTVHAEVAERDGDLETIRLWATANGALRTWTSRREHDPAARSIAFRQTRSAHPVGGMGGRWVVTPAGEGSCHVRLLHDWFAATDDPADHAWIAEAVDRNSRSELAALRAAAESSGSGELFSFEDTVAVDGTAEDVYDFINDAQYWSRRLPHVARVALTEDVPGLQTLEMDTRTKDGSTHTTRSFRVCEPHRSIVYKQTVLPTLLSLHTGAWTIAPAEGGGVTVTSRHTVRIDPARIIEVVGAGADLAAARAAVRTALSGNSSVTLNAAKAWAEAAGGRAAS